MGGLLMYEVSKIDTSFIVKVNQQVFYCFEMHFAWPRARCALLF